ncbi:MAG: lipid-A-disaccharide synthase [Alphaproteobacteria bacterium]|nr:lipid-A-disaccharide synthase [Alphaproteobacteria bacterium]
MTANRPLRIYVIAGEASGDFLGGQLMAALKEDHPAEITFFGVGGPNMTTRGIASLFPYHELSMMGFIEILPYIFNLAARINRTVEDILAKKPDVVVTIDSPGFCFRVVEKLRKAGLQSKFVHYVAPTVWAYKPERALRCKKLFDHLLVLLPFEPPYFNDIGLPCTFVGHPIVAETEPGNGAAFRKKYEIAPEVPLFCLLPGSRRGEVLRHLPVFARAIGMLARQYPNLAIVVTVPKHVLPFIAPYFANCPFRAVILASNEDKKDAMAACDFAIVKSGTVALEVAMAGIPMVITYRVHPISAWMFRRIRITKFANLVNILLKREVIPELLQELCNPLMLASAAASLYGNAENKAAQTTAAREALNMLIPPLLPPSHIAAQTILKLSSKSS